MAMPRIAAGALFRDSHGRVLLVHPTYKKIWDIPGGYVEPGESPLAACVREIREELGIAPPVSAERFVVDWAPLDGEGDKLLFVFHGGVMDDDNLSRIRLAEHEITEWRFVDPADLDELAGARLAQRIRTALLVTTYSGGTYAEHGHAVQDIPHTTPKTA